MKVFAWVYGVSNSPFHCVITETLTTAEKLRTNNLMSTQEDDVNLLINVEVNFFATVGINFDTHSMVTIALYNHFWVL